MVAFQASPFSPCDFLSLIRVVFTVFWIPCIFFRALISSITMQQPLVTHLENMRPWLSKNILRVPTHLINSLVGHKIPLPQEYRVAASNSFSCFFNFFFLSESFFFFFCLWNSAIEIMYILGGIFKIYSAWHSTWGTVTLWLWNFSLYYYVNKFLPSVLSVFSFVIFTMWIWDHLDWFFSYSKRMISLILLP